MFVHVLHACVRAYVWACTSVDVCICVVCTCVCLLAWMYAFVGVLACVECVFACVDVSVLVWMCAFMRGCCVYMCVCAQVHACVCPAECREPGGRNGRPGLHPLCPKMAPVSLAAVQCLKEVTSETVMGDS